MNEDGSAKRETGVRLELLRELRKRAGMTINALFKRTNCGLRTIQKADEGKPVNVDTAEKIAGALHLKVADLMGPASFAERTTEDYAVGTSWRLGVNLGTATTSNGLRWKIFELRHQHAERKDRGKVYDASHVSTRDHRDMAAYFTRHHDVCRRVCGCPNVVQNCDTFPDTHVKGHWWVIDEWLDGPTLASVLKNGALPAEKLPTVMREVAQGLAAMHEAGIIRRDLSPASICLTKRGAVLTDFELAKLVGSLVTVSAGVDWSGDYRAPEIVKPDAQTPSCDLYSWARIFAHAACGELPRDDDHSKELLNKAAVPKRVRDVVLECLLSVRRRPKKIDYVLSAMDKWK